MRRIASSTQIPLLLILLAGASLLEAQEREIREEESATVQETQVDGFDHPGAAAAKLEVVFGSTGYPRVIETKRMPLSDEAFQARVQAGKTSQLDPQTRELVYRHITDYLPEGWGNFIEPRQNVDSLGNPIVNKIPGLPGWAQRDIDALRDAIRIWQTRVSRLPTRARTEAEAVLGNYIAQAMVRGIDIGDLVDLSDTRAVTDGVGRAVLKQLNFYENIKALRADDAGYEYKPTSYNASILGFIQAHGSMLDQVREIPPHANLTPSGCYTKTDFTRGMTNLSGATIIWQTSGEDDAQADVPIGFRHYFYSCDDPNDNSNVRVSTNGYLTFFERGGGTLNGTNFNNDSIPSTTDPDGYVAPSWDDYFVATNQGNLDTVSYKTEGAVGQRVFTVEWFSMSRLGGDTDDWHFFQVKLFEATGNVELHTSTDWNADTLDNSTVGLEDFSGLDGDCGPNCTNTNLQPPDNYRFAPDRPANDSDSFAACLAPDVSPISSDTFGATGTDFSTCAFNDHKDVWYRYHSPASGNVTFDTCGSGFDTTLAVYNNTATTEIGCNDDTCGLQSSLTVNLNANTDYRIRVAGYDGQEGNFLLARSGSGPTPTGDTCNIAWNITGGFLGFTDNNTGCIDQTTCAFNDVIDEWFAWTAPVGGLATATTCSANTNYDTTLAVFDACGGTELACNDDDVSCPTGTLQSTVQWPVVAGQTYYLRVSGYNGTHGNYDLQVISPDMIFADGFESGDTFAWSSCVGC